MSDIMKLLKDPLSVPVFDVDGVLAAYEYGQRNHNACQEKNWDEYIKNYNIYLKARPIKAIQDIVAQKSREKKEGRIFVCTNASTKEEKQAKFDFVCRNYMIPSRNVLYSNDDFDKLRVLNGIYRQFNELDPKYIIMVDDTAKLLGFIQDHSMYSTMHISSFLE